MGREEERDGKGGGRVGEGKCEEGRRERRVRVFPQFQICHYTAVRQYGTGLDCAHILTAPRFR